MNYGLRFMTEAQENILWKILGDWPWVFFGRNDAKAETLVLWPPHVKSQLIGKDSDAGRDLGARGEGDDRG